MLTSFFEDDDFHFSISASTSHNSAVRSYSSFAQAAAECGMARILVGFHLRSAVYGDLRRVAHGKKDWQLDVLATLLATLSSVFRSRAALELENLAMRHQIGVLQRSVRKRPRLTPLDRLLWVWQFAIWSDFGSRATLPQSD